MPTSETSRRQKYLRAAKPTKPGMNPTIYIIGTKLISVAKFKVVPVRLSSARMLSIIRLELHECTEEAPSLLHYGVTREIT